MTVGAEATRDAVVAALRSVGLVAAPQSDCAADLTADVNGEPLALQLKAVSTVTPDVARRWASWPRTGVATITVLVADRVLQSARTVLDDLGIGWLDLRGHLHLSAPGVLVDADVPATRPLGGPADPFSGVVGLEVACSLLLAPQTSVRIRALARSLGRSPSSISAAVERLRNEQLITGDGLPAIPNLFWALAAAWRPVSVEVAAIPDEADPVVAAALRTGWGEPSAETRWVLTDTLAASVYGAPIGVSSDYPPSFYVTDEAIARRAETLLGVPQPHTTPAATICVAPVPQICALPSFGSFPATVFPGKQWPLAHPLFVALDLAGDPGRGSEVLAGWRPQEETVRVW